jgi:ubiquitin thioesterase protein OTUB1
MQFHADQYQGFLETTIEDYRQSRIEAHAQEIEQIGLQALTDGIVAPAGVALEVLYLDRSQGDEVTPHMFVQDAHDRPTIRLLYRP